MVAAIPYRLPSIEVKAVQEVDEVIEIIAEATSATSNCPQCHQPSSQVQSRYKRHSADLPWSGKVVRLLLEVRRFFCRNPACPCQVFCERLPQVIPVYARQTLRLKQSLMRVAFALGGEAGARLAKQLGMPTSPDTLLRLIRRQPLPAIPAPRVVGIDDWALRRGHTYGTIICDLEQRRPIDLLPDREAETVANWFRAHPSVEIVTRDRSEAYARGVSSGAPQAVQMADRWHLLKNMIDATEAVLACHPVHLTRLLSPSQRTPQNETQVDKPGEALALTTTTSPTPKSQQKRAERFARYNQVMALRQKGLTLRQIAHQVRISERTVNRWLAVGHFPEHRRRTRQPSC
jgi:transposase